jgi:hypothetical protein
MKRPHVTIELLTWALCVVCAVLALILIARGLS